MKTTEQLTRFHQGNMSAIMATGQVLARGMQDWSGHVTASAQTAMAETISAWRAMAGVTSVQEALALQASFARSTVEKAMADGTRLTETGFRLAEQAAAPLAARLGAVVEVLTPAA